MEHALPQRGNLDTFLSSEATTMIFWDWSEHRYICLDIYVLAVGRRRALLAVSYKSRGWLNYSIAFSCSDFLFHLSVDFRIEVDVLSVKIGRQVESLDWVIDRGLLVKIKWIYFKDAVVSRVRIGFKLNNGRIAVNSPCFLLQLYQSSLPYLDRLFFFKLLSLVFELEC